jgi:uncharacterized protein involved in tolerance to divalent cations
MSYHLLLQISAESKEQAYAILDALLAQKLVTGGQIINAPARFLWKEKIVDMDYFTVTSYTIEKHKSEIISVVKMISVEEVPMITFTAFEANQELLGWIATTVAGE